ncbi:MAG: hypothetical protein ACOVP4_10400 [Bacteriovoracaceae bacterium]
MKKLSRMEANKEARRVLAKHGTDLSECQYSCSGSEVRINGYLRKIDGSEFSVQGIEAMIVDFGRHLPGFYIAGDCKNWNFNSDHVNHVGSSKENNKGAGEIEQHTYYVDLDDIEGLS